MPTSTNTSAQPLSLAGAWRFALDRDQAGVSQNWFAQTLAEQVRLPGGLTEQGIGDPITVTTPWTAEIVEKSWFTAAHYAPYRQPENLKIPFWLQPDRYYAGAAWYQRDVEIPAAWRGQGIRLHLERPHIVTRVWLDERELGTHDSLATPHDYMLGTEVTPGRHRLTILVDNLHHVDVGPNSHSVTDHTQGNWNGIVGRIELQPLGTAWIETLRIAPDAAHACVGISGRVAGTPSASARLQFTLTDPDGVQFQVVPTLLAQADGTFAGKFDLPSAVRRWDEFSPAVYQLGVTPEGGLTTTVAFGFRELGRAGAQLTINGRKLFLRGTLDCASFPRTGHPPTDLAAWQRHFATIQSYGLNHVRFHSWCPPEAAFIAADLAGVYLQVECSSWANTTTTTLGDGAPVDAWIYAEAERILATYGNHPSFVLMAYGNEPGGDHHAAYLSKWVSRFKAADPRRLYTSGAGWPALPENDFHNLPEPRIQRWAEGLGSRVNALPPATTADYFNHNAQHLGGTPVISHEIGQWCAYPNFAEIAKYTGYLKAKNFEIYRDTLAAHHMADQAGDFLQASGRLQTLLYKEEIESTLRTRNMSGFQLLGLQDFSGQGTALVGVLDAFWENKGYVTPAEFRRFCAPTVLLARLPKRVFTVDETLIASLEVAHFGAASLTAVTVGWRLVADDGRTVAQGELPAATLPVDNDTALGTVVLKLAGLPVPARYKLVASLPAASVENEWDVWVYPSTVAVAAPAGVRLLHGFGPAARDALAGGERVVCVLPPETVADDPATPIQYGFSSIFWNTLWTRGQAPSTLGILCDPTAPALADFPTDSHSNWQWWYPGSHARPMILDGLPPQLRPVVQVIDDWFANRRLGFVIEAQVGPGQLLLCSADVLSAKDPVSRQLLASLLTYAAGPRFRPSCELTLEQINGLITPASAARA